jgi:hypothetical protein
MERLEEITLPPYTDSDEKSLLLTNANRAREFLAKEVEG